MRVLVTGANGFIGRVLVPRLAARADVDDLVLVDRVAGTRTDHATWMAGDLTDQGFTAEVMGRPFDSIFHLAASLTIDAERDPDTGWAANVGVPMRLLAACRRQETAPKFVFVSSIAVFGGELPETVGDDQRQAPRTSYGTAKSIVELLLADHTRAGHVDGRSLRLPIVVIRPGTPAPVVSDIVASLAREPLHGRPFTSPIGPDLAFPVVSVQRAAANLMALHDAPSNALGHHRALNQPALTVTPREIRESVARVAGEEAAALLSFEPDDAIEAVVAGWPTRFVSGAALGLQADPDFDTIIHHYLADGND